MVMDGRHRKPLQRASGGGGVSGVNRILIDEWAQVKSDSPDTTFSYMGTGLLRFGLEYQIAGATSIWTKVVVKFASVLPSAGANPYCSFAKGADYPQTQFPTGSAELLTISGNFYADAITDDFDCSAITWNILSGLTLASQPASISELAITRKERGFMSNHGLVSCFAAGWDGAYGAVLYFDLTSASWTGTPFAYFVEHNANPNTGYAWFSHDL